jgi:hypothetical protein
MDDDGALLLKGMITKALEKCTDIELLNFIYKLIIYDTQESNSTATA